MTRPTDRWDSGEAYEAYGGRWSRVVAREFVGWLPIGPGRQWLRRRALQERLRTTLPVTADGRIELTARAWAVKGHKPH